MTRVDATSGVVNSCHVLFGNITIRASQERNEGSIGIIHSSGPAPLDERRLVFSDISRTVAIAIVHRAVSLRGGNDSPPITTSSVVNSCHVTVRQAGVPSATPVMARRGRARL